MTGTTTQPEHETMQAAVSESLIDDAGRWLGPIAAMWPGQTPDFCVVPLAEFIERPAGTGPVVVVIAPDESRSVLHKLVDALQQTMRPAVVLCEDPSIAASLDSAGVSFRGWSTDAAEIVHALRALQDRQPIVDRLSAELRIAHSMLGGAQGEMARLQEEMQLAATVQRGFMPVGTPKIDGLNLGVIYRPAGFVSGDIFDVCALDDDHVAFFIADAVGHGVPAALYTLAIAGSLRKTIDIDGERVMLSPSEALTRLNRELVERASLDGKFATAVYGILNTATGEGTLAGAGHPPPILSRNGVDTRLETQGPLLGVFTDVEFTEVSFTMEPGDVLVLFSDGFEVAFPDAEATGRQLKLPTLTHIAMLSEAQDHGCNLAEAAAWLERELDQQAGSLHQADDVTALFISLAPAAVNAAAA